MPAAGNNRPAAGLSLLFLPPAREIHQKMPYFRHFCRGIPLAQLALLEITL
jgi:hypothetical protein